MVHTLFGSEELTAGGGEWDYYETQLQEPRLVEWPSLACYSRHGALGNFVQLIGIVPWD